MRVDGGFWWGVGVAAAWVVLLVAALVGLSLLVAALVGLSLLVARLTGYGFIEGTRVVQAIGTLGAICVGGVYAYHRLQVFRTFEPHLTVSHDVSHRPIGDSYVHVGVTVTLHNSSKVKIEPQEGLVRVQQVAPVSDREVEALYVEVFGTGEQNSLQWTTLDELPATGKKIIVEPNESHRGTFEFIVHKDAETVIIYSYFRNPRFSRPNQSAEGWGATTIYDIRPLQTT